MEAEKKKVEENQDNIINKIYDYYSWEKNEKPKEEKVFVICANDLQKFKDYIKYKDLKDYMNGKNPIINCIQQFYEEKKINIKYSEDNKNICIKIKEKNEGDKIIENSEVEINKNVVDLIKSLGYNIENDVKEKIDNKEEKEKENEQKKLEADKNNENDKKGAVEDEKPEEGNDAKEGKKEEKEIKPNEEINGENKDDNKEENKEVKKDEIKEEKKEEKKEENKEENKDDKKEENKEKKKDENKEVNTEEKKEENKEVKNDEIKPEIKDEIKEVKNCENKEEKKDEIKPEKTDEIKEEKRDVNNEDEKNKKSENEQKVEDKPQKEITVPPSEAKKEEINKNEKVENQEPKIDSTNLEKEIKEIEKLANPPKLSTIKKEESQGETSDLKLVNVISYDEKEDIKIKEKNNKNKKDAKTRKKSDIKNDLLNKNQSEEEPKEENLLNKKRYNDLKMLSSETKSNQDEVEEEPKNKENENVDENKKENENVDEIKKENENADENKKENEINTDSNKIQIQNDQTNNETNAIINQENNNDNNINNNNIQNQEMNNLQMMQFQEMLFQKYLFEHGFENNFLNSYYQNTNKEEPDDGLPQIVNGKVKLQSDKPSLGLQNVGATCYMNATLQCLMHIKELSEQLLSAFFFKYPRDNENFAAKHKLSNKYVNLLSQVFFPTLNGNSTKYYAPYEFKTIISEINPLFAGYAANDAKDLLQCILENLHQELKQSTQMFYDYIIDQKNEQMGMQYFFNSYITQNKSPINDYLYGINEIKTTCSICKITKYNFQSYNLLYFPLKEAKRVTVLKKKEKDKDFDEENYILTLEDCFAHNQHIDHFTGDNKMYCNECKKEADADYQTVLFTTPTILSIVLNRGRANKDFQEDFKFGVELDIKEYIHNTAFKHGKYYLIGMVVHSGDSSLAGHFVAYCRMDKNSKWFLYNDAFVSEEEDIEAKFKENKPYILFYHYDNDNDVEQK